MVLLLLCNSGHSLRVHRRTQTRLRLHQRVPGLRALRRPLQTRRRLQPQEQELLQVHALLRGRPRR